MGSGGSFSVSFSFDDQVFVGAMLIIFAGLGLATVVLGVITLARGSQQGADTDRWTRLALADVRRQLALWQAVPGGASSAAIERDVLRVSRRRSGAATLGAGVGLLAVLASITAVSLAMTGSVLAVSALSGYVLSGLFFCGFLMGAATGSWVDIWSLRRAARGIAYADLRRRRLSDYRAGVLRWLPAALIAYDAALTTALAPQLGPSLRVELSGGWILSLPTIPLLWALPLAMLLILLGGEWAMRRTVELPRLLVTSDPVASQRADEMLRAQIIGVLQSFVLLPLGYFGSAQWALLAFQIVRTHPAFTPLDGALLLATVVLLPGFLLPAARGRLGGAQTGWPWQPRVTA